MDSYLAALEAGFSEAEARVGGGEEPDEVDLSEAPVVDDPATDADSGEAGAD